MPEASLIRQHLLKAAANQGFSGRGEYRFTLAWTHLGGVKHLRGIVAKLELRNDLPPQA